MMCSVVIFSNVKLLLVYTVSDGINNLGKVLL